MRQGKYSKNSRKRTAKASAVLIAMLLLGCLAVGGTVAFLMDTDGPLKNLFQPSQVITEVDETLSGNTKSNVRIRNSGNTDAWIRAAVVVTWQDKDGKVYGKAPVENTDYEIEWGTGWLKGADGFYYWKDPVASGGETGDLIESCTSKGTPPNGYYLTVEIIGSGIQSKPVWVFNTEWASSGLTANGNSLTKR